VAAATGVEAFMAEGFMLAVSAPVAGAMPVADTPAVDMPVGDTPVADMDIIR
jgi:hypothetical protein